MAFGRKNFKNADLHTKFLQRYQNTEELFSSFNVELLVICDEMNATREQEKESKANEIRVVNQFVHGIHDRLVK